MADVKFNTPELKKMLLDLGPRAKFNMFGCTIYCSEVATDGKFVNCAAILIQTPEGGCACHFNTKMKSGPFNGTANSANDTRALYEKYISKDHYYSFMNKLREIYGL